MLAECEILFIDLDNTAYPYEVAHQAGLDRAAGLAARFDRRWAQREAFVRCYLAARAAVQARLRGRAAVHCRLLYFKTMLELQTGRSRLAQAVELHDAYWQGYFEGMHPEPGCAGVLAALRQMGKTLVWITNYTTERQIRKLRALRLLEAADLLITSEEAGAEKPDPAIIGLAHERLQLTAGERKACVLGDSLAHDQALAERVGLPFIWFCRTTAPSGKPGPRYVVRSWPEVGALFQCREGRA